MKSKPRLAFDMLEKEMESLTHHDAKNFNGGSGNYDPGTDCFFQCLAYAGSKYGGQYLTQFYEHQYDNYFGQGASGNGADPNYANAFASQYFNVSNITSNDISTFVADSENTLIVYFDVLIFTGSTLGINGHAGIVQSVNEDGSYEIFDPQQNSYYSIEAARITGGVPITGTSY